MPELRRIYQGKFFSQHSQLHLLDATAEEGIEWGSGEEEVVITTTGAAFTVRNDAPIEVNIYHGVGKPGGRFVGRGTIEVGAAGLEIGNLFSDADLIPWPTGKTTIAIYLHSRQPWMARKVSIVLQPEHDAVQIDATNTNDAVRARAEELFDSARQSPTLADHVVAQTLARLGTESILALLEATTDSDPRIRSIALYALGLLGTPQAVPALLTALADPETDVQQESILWLGRLRDQRAVAPLLARLETAEGRLRGHIVGSLGELRDRRAIEPVRVLLDSTSEDPFVREQAARALGQLRATIAIPDLADHFRRGDNGIRNAIMQSFIGLGKAALPAVLSLAQDNDPAVRGMAALTLGNWRRQSVIEPLITLLHDPVPTVRVNAVGSVSRLRNVDLCSILLPLVEDTHTDVRYAAVVDLGQRGDPRALPALEQVRQHDPGVTTIGYRIDDAAANAITLIQAMNR